MEQKAENTSVKAIRTHDFCMMDKPEKLRWSNWLRGVIDVEYAQPVFRCDPLDPVGFGAAA